MKVENTTTGTKEGGFTLVEVIVSMFLMAMIFTAAFGSYFLGMRMVEDAREELRASQIIQSELEAMRTLNWSDMEELPTSAYFEPQGEFIQQFSDKYTSLRYVYTINDEQKVVFIRISWTNSRGRTTYQWFNTIFTRFGLNDYYYRKV